MSPFNPVRWVTLTLYIALCSSLTEAQPLKNITDVEHLHQKMIYKAMDKAKEAYVSNEEAIPTELKELDYQEYRDIRFLTEKAIWKNESLFEIQLFHPGFLYKKPVSIYEIVEDSIINIPFSRDFFRYDGESHTVRDLTQSDINFSGLRVHYPLNNKNYKDELIVFQGASYFRPLGPGLLYGVSARGLAIDTAEPSGEEFPHFTEFWLVKPTSKATSLTIYALLESQSVTGAYRFELLPGLPTKISVDVDLFARNDIKKIGIAPITSMFFYGENSINREDDFRPEVHDSDGLLLATNNHEWIWRPLSNPKNLHVSTFTNNQPQGFGLLQRDRQFNNYQDTEAFYDRRPSLWVKPKNNSWGEGRVELVEIPTSDETNDNIVAYWVPQKGLKAGEKLKISYELNIIDTPHQTSLGKVVQTRNGWGALPGTKNPPPKTKRQFIIDFAGWPENSLNPEMPIKPKLVNNRGVISDLMVFPLPDKKTWRASFKLEAITNEPIDMSLSLLLGEQQITETWSYVWHPDEVK